MMSADDFMRHVLGSPEPVERDPRSGCIYERGHGALSHAEQDLIFAREAQIAADLPREGEICSQTLRPYECGHGALPKSMQTQAFLNQLPAAAKVQRQADANALLAVEPAGRA
jgi:hypothetical protein